MTKILYENTVLKPYLLYENGGDYNGKRKRK